MRGLVAQREAAVVRADHVGELRPARHHEQRVARAASRDLRAQRPQRRAAGLAREPAADLDDRQHARGRRAARELGERGRGRHVALGRAPRQLEHGRPEALAASRAMNAPLPSATTGPRAARSACATCRAAASTWRTCSACRYAAIASISCGRELLGVRADQPRDALARARDARRSPVRRRAVVASGRDVPEDQMHVGADREQLGGDRAPAPRTGTRGAIAARFVRSAPV